MVLVSFFLSKFPVPISDQSCMFLCLMVVLLSVQMAHHGEAEVVVEAEEEDGVGAEEVGLLSYSSSSFVFAL